MTVYGVTPTGFVPQTADQIRSDYELDLRSTFYKSLPLGDKTALGHIIGILSASLGDLWALVELAFNMMDPDKVSGAMLQALCLLTGTFKLDATASVVAETLVGDTGTLVPFGTLISTISTKLQFATLADAVLVALPIWAPTTAYGVGNRVSNGANAYQCITAGASAGAGGPTTTLADIVDGTAHWKFLGVGLAAVDTVVAATSPGPIFAAAGDLTDIVNEIGGLNAAINLTDATLGRDVQSDQSLRLLREEELAKPGTGTPDAVRAELLQISNVTNAIVFFNNTESVDGDGRPPKTAQVLIQGGADQDIWDALWANIPLGIRTLGDQVGFVTDSQGTVQTLRFSRPTAVPIYIAITVTVDPLAFPDDGATQIKAAIAAFGDAQVIGKDAVARQLGAQAFQVAGVDDFPSCFISIAPGPTTEATIPIGLLELATYDTTHIAVTVIEAAP